MKESGDLSNSPKVAAIAEDFGRRAGPSAAEFARRLFADVDKVEFEAYSADELAYFAKSAFASFANRRPGEAKIKLDTWKWAPVEAWAVHIVHDDMPFLLDSVLGTCRELGLVPNLVVHPIFTTSRDSEGRLLAFECDDGGTTHKRRESFIHLQIEKTRPRPSAREVEQALADVLARVRLVVGDFDAMTARLAKAIAALERNPPPVPAEIEQESIAFLRWLTADRFVFLGVREYDYVGDNETGQLLPRQDGLGLLRDMSVSILRREGETDRLTPASRAYFLGSPPVTVGKANAVSTVHRRARMDTIGIKRYREDGSIAGQLRIAGLFAATVYNAPTQEIPLLRLKTAEVFRSSGHSPDSYSGRSLANILQTFPRDELFQISAAQLAEIADEILKIELAPRPRVFVRRDDFERFVSVFVYVPRERYTTDVRIELARMLEEEFDGICDSFTPFFPESPMVRVHFAIWRKDRDLRAPSEPALEAKVEAIVRTWSDDFCRLVLAHHGSEQGYRLIERYGNAFPADYRDANPPARALEDIERIERLGPSRQTDIDLHRDDLNDPNRVRATMLQLDKPLPLSRRVPVLENFGFAVQYERTYRVTPDKEGARVVYLHHSDLSIANGAAAVEFGFRRAILEEGFLAVWNGAAASDHLNALMLVGSLDWRGAAVFRAYIAYLRQTGVPFGAAYMAEVCVKHAAIVSDLFRLFDTLFNPERDVEPDLREHERERLASEIAAKLDRIPVLDEDRILRNMLTLVEATLRTDFFTRVNGTAPQTIAFKFKSAAIPWLPAPKPYAEIFVYSPRFEGIHLRNAPIARGGLRWSDRPQDFRTEILSLAKAQQVKNVVIVPRGAKGGFVPRRLPKLGREAVQEEGIACYKSFVSTLLSLTDNLCHGKAIPPAGVVRRDGDDAYLVVAADKGTATFSDIANAIAVERGFWLGDAFASGGSDGYDHKKMGITARGAWEAVKRHFRELNIDIQTTPFTVAGVGDMSGDVFGNGMLLSKEIKLVAAFDHRDIFIDPAPDPSVSWEERRRLFELPRSSWKDYDRNKLSEGGGIYSRTEKYIAPSGPAQALLGVGPLVTPNELIAAIIKAPVDLLWFGGIGTYVRGSGETDADAGDKANDAVRATANHLRARVVGEGANLAVTQRGRIEYAARGGRINTDAIDNSAGVNTSDVEVNIKIALGTAMAAGKLDLPGRNAQLKAMTDAVAAMVLRNNYLQTLALSLAEREGLGDLGFQRRLMQSLEAKGLLDRQVEALPSDAAMVERFQASAPLTRPELAMLLAYAKIDLENLLTHSSIPDDPYFGRALLRYFPALMRERFSAEIERHPLRREIVATGLANEIVNRGGPTFVVRLVDETGHAPEDVAYAFAAVMSVYDVAAVCADIDALDGVVDGVKQLDLYRKVQDLLRRQTAWFLRHGLSEVSLGEEIERYREGVSFIGGNLDAILPEPARQGVARERQALEAIGVPKELAAHLSTLDPLSQALDAILVANASKVPLDLSARTIFAIRDWFRLDALAAAGEALANGDYFERLAINSSIAAASATQRAIARAVFLNGTAAGGFEAWKESNKAAADRVAETIRSITEGRSFSLAKLTVAISQLRDLGVS